MDDRHVTLGTRPVSADPRPFSGVNTGRRELIAGQRYKTAGGRTLTVMSADDRLVFYRADESTSSLRADRRTFEAAIRGSDPLP